MKTGPRKKFFVPATLNLPEMLREKGLEQPKDREFVAKCCYVIDMLYIRRAMQKAEWTEFFPINLEVLRGILGWRGAPAVKRALIKTGIIEPEMKNGTETYQSAVRSKAYRFCAQYHHTRFHAVDVPCEKLRERLRVARGLHSETATSKHPGKRLIWESVQKLEFEADAARSLAAGRAFKTEDERNWWASCIEWMENRDWRFSEDAQGRVYHPLTNLPTDLRQFVTFEGRRLYSVDVSASHPCLLSRLYKADCEEKARYVRLVSTGEFYGHLNAKLSHSYDLSAKGQKDALKEEIFHRVFYGSAYAKLSPIGEAFAAEFPVLAGLVRHEKRRHQRDLANPLQKIESQIVIDAVASRFAERHAGENVCLVSVHDCFFTMLEDTEELAELLAKEYERVVRFRPRVKIQEIKRERRLPATAYESPDWNALREKVQEDNARQGIFCRIPRRPLVGGPEDPNWPTPHKRNVVSVF